MIKVELDEAKKITRLLTKERDLLFIAFALERHAEHSDAWWNRCNTPAGYFALYINGVQNSMFCYLLADEMLPYIKGISEKSHEEFGLQRKLEYKKMNVDQRIKLLLEWVND